MEFSFHYELMKNVLFKFLREFYFSSITFAMRMRELENLLPFLSLTFLQPVLKFTSMNRTIFIPFILICVSLMMGCDDGDVQKASGNYEVTVVDPSGKSAVGTASVANSGDFFSIVINSAVGDFAFAGTLADNKIETTFTDASGSSATAVIQFSPDRSTFTGSIQTSTGLFVIRGSHL
jgi:hypothetical protein